MVHWTRLRPIRQLWLLQKHLLLLTFPSSAAAGAAPPRSPVLASGCRGRTSRGGDDHDAADAGDAAAGFDFGDAARMAAELAPILGGAPAGQRGH